MLRNVTRIIAAVIFATLVRHAVAQEGTPAFQEMQRDLARGYTKKELIDEKKLLLDNSRTITWEWLPLIEYPRRRPLPALQPSDSKPVVAKFSELPPSKLEAAQEKFVDEKLKDRRFSGTVRIARNEPNGGKFTIYAQEPLRPNPFLTPPHGFAMMWPRYFCQWESESDRGFHVGENADIVGKIEDLKEDGKTNTLFLKDVAIAPAAEKAKSQ
jgi:hypothetical protein